MQQKTMFFFFSLLIKLHLNGEYYIEVIGTYHKLITLIGKFSLIAHCYKAKRSPKLFHMISIEKCSAINCFDIPN